MNRLKILLLVLIVAVLVTVFVQNKEPIALKLLCQQSNSQYCLYRTPQLPLAVWISLFLFGGAMTSILSQIFSRYSYSSPRKKYATDDLYSESKNWVDRDTPSGKNTPNRTTIEKPPSSASNYSIYEADQQPQSVERTGSNYSYKYRPTDREQKNKERDPQTSIDLNKDVNSTQESEDENWI